MDNGGRAAGRGGTGVPEVWRHRRGTASIVRLEGGTYIPAPDSVFVAGLTAEALTELLDDGLGSGFAPWSERVRAWSRSTA